MGMTAYTIEQWLLGMVDYDVPQNTIMAILYNNGVTMGMPMFSISEKQKDLCLADLLMWLSSSSTTSQAEIISDSGWSHQKSGKIIHDRVGLIQKAKTLYSKWGSAKADEPNISGIKMKSLY